MRIRVGVVVLLVAAVVGATSLSPAQASFAWAPAASAGIHPGVQTVTAGGQCTANFVFTDADGAVYLGQAAHCGSPDPDAAAACVPTPPEPGTEVEIQGATRPGTLAYNSWYTMQTVGGASADQCRYNDFALVRVHPDDHRRVNPSVPVWGGPVGGSGGTAAGETVFGFGNSSLRLGLEPLSPKAGVSLGPVGGGWGHSIYAVSPGIPGDSGSAFLDADGRAVGVLSTVTLLPPAANELADLQHALGYLAANTGLDLTLAEGTEPFVGLGGLVPGLVGGLVGTFGG